MYNVVKLGMDLSLATVGVIPAGWEILSLLTGCETASRMKQSPLEAALLGRRSYAKRYFCRFLHQFATLFMSEKKIGFPNGKQCIAVFSLTCTSSAK